jgi:hypothetical protein
MIRCPSRTAFAPQLKLKIASLWCFPAIGTIDGEGLHAFTGDLQGIVYRDIVVSQKVQGMGFGEIVEAVQHDGFVDFSSPVFPCGGQRPLP